MQTEVKVVVPLRKAVLIALVRGESFGLDIMRRVERAGYSSRLHQGNVYPLLRDLEREGLLESFEGEPMPSRGRGRDGQLRRRRYYKLTVLGRQVATARS